LVELPQLCAALDKQDRLVLQGIHGYDGHIHDPDPDIRSQQSDVSYQLLKEAYTYLVSRNQSSLLMVIGGSPSFSSHATRVDVICSPGTFIFWDWGYAQKIPEQNFDYAAVLLTRVISTIDSNHICVDLGYKAVASDPPAERVMFLNAPHAKIAFQSEEHLVLKVVDSRDFPIGMVLYGIPTHICPTVALYDQVEVIQENQKTGTWQIIGRNRKLTI
ncbi:MAG: D-TA family PLP-dependent enzyme, partial [Sphingobacterium sp.]